MFTSSGDSYDLESPGKNACIAASVCITVMAYWNLILHDKNVDVLGVLPCRATSFGCLRQGTTFPRMTSRLCSLFYFEHSLS